MCFGGGVKLTTPEMEPLGSLRDDEDFTKMTPVMNSAAQRAQPRSIMTQTPSLLMRRSNGI